LPDGTAAKLSISQTLDARGDMIESKVFELKEREQEED